MRRFISRSAVDALDAMPKREVTSHRSHHHIDELPDLCAQLENDNLIYGRSVARVGETDGKPWIERIAPHTQDWATALVEIENRRAGFFAIDEMSTIPDETFERFAGDHLAESEPPPALHTSANEGAR